MYFVEVNRFLKKEKKKQGQTGDDSFRNHSNDGNLFKVVSARKSFWETAKIFIFIPFNLRTLPISKKFERNRYNGDESGFGQEVQRKILDVDV